MSRIRDHNPYQNVNHPGLVAQSNQTTSDSTTLPATIFSFPVPYNSALTVRGIGTAVRTDVGDGLGITFFVTALNNAGTVTVINSVYETISNSTLTLTFTGVGNLLTCNATVTPTGTFNWKVSYQWQSVAV